MNRGTATDYKGAMSVRIAPADPSIMGPKLLGDGGRWRLRAFTLHWLHVDRTVNFEDVCDIIGEKGERLPASRRVRPRGEPATLRGGRTREHSRHLSVDAVYAASQHALPQHVRLRDGGRR